MNKELIRRALDEEFATIIKGDGKKLSYDVEFKGDEVAGEKIDVSENILSYVHVNTPYSDDEARKAFNDLSNSVGLENIISFVNTVDFKCFAPLTGEPKLDSDLLQTLHVWEPKNRIGRGEAQLKLQYAFDMNAKEPDFVPYGHKQGYSVKFFGSKGSGTAKNKGAGSELVSNFIELYKSLPSLSKSKTKSLSTSAAEDVLFDIDAKKEETLKAMLGLLTNMKAELIHEHDAKAIIAFSGTDMFVTENPDDFTVSAIRRDEGSRFEVYFGDNKKNNGLEGVLRNELGIPSKKDTEITHDEANIDDVTDNVVDDEEALNEIRGLIRGIL